jgi:hypothetical protein
MTAVQQWAMHKSPHLKPDTLISNTFSLVEWIECDLMMLQRINTSINMSDHMTKGLQTILFHQHTNFLLGHVPPTYSLIYESTIGTDINHMVDTTHFVPPSFTTPTTMAAARVYAPILSDYINSPWLHILGHGLYNPHVHRLSHLLCSHISLWIVGGGDIG